jgi:hypothetical protein
MVPVALGPLNLGQRLDGAWSIITCAPGTVYALAAAIVLPAHVLVALLLAGHRSVPHLSVLTWSMIPSLEGEPGTAEPLSILLAGGVLHLSYAVLGAALSVVVAGWYQGEHRGAGEALRRLLPLTPSIVGAWALLVPLRLVAAAVCGGFPALSGVVSVFAVVVVPVIAIEHARAWAGTRRAFGLARSRFAAVAGTLLVSVLIEALVFAAGGLLLAFLASLLPGSIPEAAQFALVSLLSLFTAPVVVGVSIIIYFDLRVRREGLDLQLDADEVFGAR